MKEKKNFLDLLLIFNILISAILVGYNFTSPPLDLTGEFTPEEKKGVFHGKCVDSCTAPEVTYQYRPTKVKSESSVLGQSSGEKKIYIDLTNQRLYAFEGNRLVYNFLVSTGKWGRTPTGIFKIWVKLRYTKMSGGSRALNTYYYLPNVPYVMYFYNSQISRSRGYGIHGTYWHSNFGHPMSHGCINMKTEEAGELYHWAEPELGGRKSIYASEDNPGTQVIIFGKAPNS
jgi:lipoprotein-anchoring transpeptidase ErfK/SrfK